MYVVPQEAARQLHLIHQRGALNVQQQVHLNLAGYTFLMDFNYSLPKKRPSKGYFVSLRCLHGKNVACITCMALSLLPF
jgi:hypothetical protein